MKTVPITTKAKAAAAILGASMLLASKCIRHCSQYFVDMGYAQLIPTEPSHGMLQ